ncbi:MAG: HNH endonuclease [Anaerolineae bacterium]
MARGPNWQRNELLLALNLYCKLPFGQYHSGNPEIQALAKTIHRTPNAVAMKLSNFASLDPYHQQRGIAGLTNTSKADRAIWEEFNNNWTALAIESENAYRTLVTGTSNDSEAPPVVEGLDIASAVTEKEQQVKVRIGQSFFRTVILNSYQQRCCVCGLPIPEMLIASHIVPWSVDQKNRLNPQNGLCLCVLHDRGFDRGFVSIGDNYELILGSKLTRYLPDETVESYFAAYDRKPIHLPDKFVPSMELLAIHRTTIFSG